MHLNKLFIIQNASESSSNNITERLNLSASSEITGLLVVYTKVLLICLGISNVDVLVIVIRVANV